ncbi:MAG: hypothetical protein AAF846_19680 [Chloroflexota bacterium]
MKQKKKKNSQSFNKKYMMKLMFRGVWFAVTIFGCGFISLIMFLHPSNQCYKTPFPTRLSVENLARIQIPSSAQNIERKLVSYSELADHTNCNLYLEFTIEPEDWLALYDSSLINNDVSLPLEEVWDDIDYGYEVANWEMPQPSVQIYSFYRYEYSNPIPRLEQWIIVDKSNSERWQINIITRDCRGFC